MNEAGAGRGGKGGELAGDEVRMSRVICRATSTPGLGYKDLSFSSQ